MQTANAWDTFLKTGSVYDYLNYCRQNDVKKEQLLSEVHDRRTDNKDK